MHSCARARVLFTQYLLSTLLDTCVGAHALVRSCARVRVSFTQYLLSALLDTCVGAHALMRSCACVIYPIFVERIA